MKEIDRFRQWMIRSPLMDQLGYGHLYKAQTRKEAIWGGKYTKIFFEWFKNFRGKHLGKKPWDDLENV